MITRRQIFQVVGGVGLIAALPLMPRWRESAIAVAGLTPHSQLFGLRLLAETPRLRLVFLQVMESGQRTLHFFDRLAAQDGGVSPDLLLLDFTLPGVDMRTLLPWMKALPVCRRLRIIVMTGSDDPAVQAETMALGADAFFQKPVSFQQFLALDDLIKVVVFGHMHA